MKTNVCLRLVARGIDPNLTYYALCPVEKVRIFCSGLAAKYVCATFIERAWLPSVARREYSAGCDTGLSARTDTKSFRRRRPS